MCKLSFAVRKNGQVAANRIGIAEQFHIAETGQQQR